MCCIFLLIACHPTNSSAQIVGSSGSDNNNNYHSKETTANNGNLPYSTINMFTGSTLFHFDKKNNSERFQFGMQFGLGHLFSETPLFLTGGIGYCIGYSAESFWFNNTSERYTVDYTNIRLPLNFGILIGSLDNLHLTLLGGTTFDYVLSQKMNKEKVDLSNVDRTSWNGQVAASVGFGGDVGIMIQYGFPFVSGVKGMWLFGASYGL